MNPELRILLETIVDIVYRVITESADESSDLHPISSEM